MVRKLMNILGIILIIAGVGILGYYAFGKIQVAYHQHQLRNEFQESTYEIPEEPEIPDEEPLVVVMEEWKPMRLFIPEIALDMLVIHGEVMSEEYLDKAPVHYEMSDLPSSIDGNVAIAGHRGGRWNFFLDLDLLEEGDELYLETGGYRFTYIVKDVFLIEPTEWWVIDSTETPSLTLTTCEPKNRIATHRLVVRAEMPEADGVTILSRVP